MFWQWRHAASDRLTVQKDNAVPPGKSYRMQQGHSFVKGFLAGSLLQIGLGIIIFSMTVKCSNKLKD